MPSLEPLAMALSSVYAWPIESASSRVKASRSQTMVAQASMTGARLIRTYLPARSSSSETSFQLKSGTRSLEEPSSGAPRGKSMSESRERFFD
jgi:hypothetical protein